MTLCAALSFPRTSALGMLYEMAVGIFIKQDFKNALTAFDELMMKTCEIIKKKFIA
jgi:hypothetical protein